jgi:hypothetical protein
MEYTIGQIGWECSQEMFPVILLKANDRDTEGLKIGQMAKVKIASPVAEISALAIVERQFKAFVNEKATATCNFKLAEMLSLAKGSKVLIGKDITEEEAIQFNNLTKEIVRNEFMRHLR